MRSTTPNTREHKDDPKESNPQPVFVTSGRTFRSATLLRPRSPGRKHANLSKEQLALSVGRGFSAIHLYEELTEMKLQQ
jgi:hypothetical protein